MVKSFKKPGWRALIGARASVALFVSAVCTFYAGTCCHVFHGEGAGVGAPRDLGSQKRSAKLILKKSFSGRA